MLVKPRRFHHGAAKAVFKGNSQGASFSDRWAPPDVDKEVPALVTIYNGEYIQQAEVRDTGQITELTTLYYAYHRHWIQAAGHYKSCSAGLRVFESNTGGWAFDTGSGDCEWCNSGSKPQLTQAVNVLIWGNQHKVKYTQNGKERTSWVFCKGVKCPYCDGGDQPVPVRRAYWPARVKDIQDLGAYEEHELGYRCARGCAQGLMADVGSVCPHCDYIYLTLDETPMSEQEFKTHLGTVLECPECKQHDYPEPGRACPQCSGETFLTLADVRIKLAVQNETPGAEKNRWALRRFGEFIMSDEQRALAQEVAVPFDFANILAPSTLSEQRVALHEPHPQQQQRQLAPPTGQTGQPYVPYGNPSGQTHVATQAPAQPQSGPALPRHQFLPNRSKLHSSQN